MASPDDLIVEDGTGFEDSNTYASIDDGNAYHGLYGNTEWTDADGGEKATALVNATQYLDSQWKFRGETVNPADVDEGFAGQALKWPRTQSDGDNLFDSRGNEINFDEVPKVVVDATLEYALSFLKTGRLRKDPEVLDASGSVVTKKREKLGPLEEETEYSETKTRRQLYANGDQLLKDSGLVIQATNRSIRN